MGVQSFQPAGEAWLVLAASLFRYHISYRHRFGGETSQLNSLYHAE